MPDPNVPVAPPPGTDWAIVKSGEEGTVAVLVLVNEGTTLDDYGWTIDSDGCVIHGEDGNPRPGQLYEMGIRRWDGVRRASKRVLRALERRQRSEAIFASERARALRR